MIKPSKLYLGLLIGLFIVFFTSNSYSQARSVTSPKKKVVTQKRVRKSPYSNEVKYILKTYWTPMNSPSTNSSCNGIDFTKEFGDLRISTSLSGVCSFYCKVKIINNERIILIHDIIADCQWGIDDYIKGLKHGTPVAELKLDKNRNLHVEYFDSRIKKQLMKKGLAFPDVYCPIKYEKMEALSDTLSDEELMKQAANTPPSFMLQKTDTVEMNKILNEIDTSLPDSLR